MQIHQLVDACIFALSFWLAFAFRTNAGVVRLLHLDPVPNVFEEYVWLYVILIPAAPLILEAQGFYNRPILYRRKETFWRLFKGCALITLGLILGLFVWRQLIARSVLIWFGFISFGLVWAKEELFRIPMQSSVAKAQIKRRFLLVGTPEETERIKAELTARAPEEVEVVGQLDLAQAPVSQLVEQLHEHAVNGVVVGTRRSRFEAVEMAIHACELEGVEVWLVANFFGTALSRTSFDDFQGRSVLVFHSPAENSWQGIVEQLANVCGGLLWLVFALPVMGVLAAIVKFTSPGPVLVRQRCAGLDGRAFTICRFRTVASNGIASNPEPPVTSQPGKPQSNGGGSPCPTPVGKVMRKYSLDELPLVFNVIYGEMSLLGPPPLPVEEARCLDITKRRQRLSVKPGIVSSSLWRGDAS
jgi:lipopolysaccharide/colanic/teichoic acid biosynthesis glycosyltransferase